MLMRTHIRIARIIASKLKLDDENLISSLVDGSIKPDLLKIRTHHYGQEYWIEKYIIEARKLFLEGKKNDALFELGMALHYIQDQWVKIISRPSQHEKWEKQIDEAPQFFDICQRLCEFEKICNRDFKGYDGYYVKDQTLKIATLDHPDSILPLYDLNFAYKTSLVVTLSVCAPEILSELQKKLEQLRNYYMKKIREAKKEIKNKLIALQDRKVEFEQKRGIWNMLKKLLLNYRISVAQRKYKNKTYLLRIKVAYENAAESLTPDYTPWFNIGSVPPLKL